jgi:hypothetical protein
MANCIMTNKTRNKQARSSSGSLLKNHSANGRATEFEHNSTAPYKTLTNPLANQNVEYRQAEKI